MKLDYEFTASPIYIVSSRPAWTTREPPERRGRGRNLRADVWYTIMPLCLVPLLAFAL